MLGKSLRKIKNIKTLEIQYPVKYIYWRYIILIQGKIIDRFIL